MLPAHCDCEQELAFQRDHEDSPLPGLQNNMDTSLTPQNGDRPVATSPTDGKVSSNSRSDDDQQLASQTLCTPTAMSPSGNQDDLLFVFPFRCPLIYSQHL